MTEVLLAACGAWVFVYVLKIYTAFPFLNRKPFICEVCLAGWFTLLLFVSPKWVDTPFYMAAAMIAVIILTNIMRKV